MKHGAFAGRRDQLYAVPLGRRLDREGVKDLSMPQLGGTQAFAEMRSVRAKVRVVLVSGFDPREIRRRFKDGSPAGFIQKPFFIEDMVKVIGEVPGPPSAA